jgi:hypothetical protein
VSTYGPTYASQHSVIVQKQLSRSFGARAAVFRSTAGQASSGTRHFETLIGGQSLRHSPSGDSAERTGATPG